MCGDSRSRIFWVGSHAGVRRKGSTSLYCMRYAMLIRCRQAGRSPLPATLWLTSKLVSPVTHEIILAGLAAFRRAPARLVSRAWVRGALAVPTTSDFIEKLCPQCRSDRRERHRRRHSASGAWRGTWHRKQVL